MKIKKVKPWDLKFGDKVSYNGEVFVFIKQTMHGTPPHSSSDVSTDFVDKNGKIKSIGFGVMNEVDFIN